MPVQGSIVNAAVIIGSALLGMIIKGKLSESFKTIIMQAPIAYFLIRMLLHI